MGSKPRYDSEDETDRKSGRDRDMDHRKRRYDSEDETERKSGRDRDRDSRKHRYDSEDETERKSRRDRDTDRRKRRYDSEDETYRKSERNRDREDTITGDGDGEKYRRKRRYDSEDETDRKSRRDRDRENRITRDGDSERYRRKQRYDSENDIDRKSRRDRDRENRISRDGDNEKYHRDKHERKQQEDNGFKEDRHGRLDEDSNPQRQSTTLEGNPNGDKFNLGRSGGVYIPPFKLARMMKEVQDKSSVEYQRLTWDALRKSINGLVNKVNAANIKNIIPELFSENLIRGRGLFCRSCMKSQMASLSFTDVFSALAAVANTNFPKRRIVLQLKRAYKQNEKLLYHSFLVVLLSSFKIKLLN